MFAATTLIMAFLAAIRGTAAVECRNRTFGTCEDNIVQWYDADDGMICNLLDCGGGRAPPKTDNPCCGNYKGTEACVTTTSYLSCFKRAAPTPAPAANDDSSNPGIVVAVPSESSSIAPIPSSALAPSPTTMAAPASTTFSQFTATTPVGLTSSPILSITTSSSTMSTGTSQTTQLSSSSNSSAAAAASAPPNAGNLLQRDTAVALLGLAVGLAAGI